MCAHYLFDADFCNVASGWEKGVVEKNVQDSRRRIWLAAQKLTWNTFDELNAWLGERCRDCWSELRHPESTEFSVLEMLEKERLVLMPMPVTIAGIRKKSAQVSNTCLVTVDRNRYSMPWSVLLKMLSACGHWFTSIPNILNLTFLYIIANFMYSFKRGLILRYVK